MPIYEYRCPCGHRFEVIRSAADSTAARCERCQTVAERVFSAPAVRFKGPGFYSTDYARSSKD